MSLTPNAGGGNFTPAPAGMHIATCVGVIDVGSQPDDFKPGETILKVYLLWELEGTRNENDDGPVIYSSEYSNYLSDSANLKKDIDAWFGKQLTPEAIDAGFHLGKLLGCSCMLNIIHRVSKKGRTYAVHASISPLLPNQPKPIATTTHMQYDVDDPDEIVFGQIDKWIQKKIMASPEWQAKQGPQDTGDNPHEPITEDDIPF